MIDGVNPHIIQDLGRELNSPHLALRFLTDFLAMLPRRFTRIQSAVAAEDGEDAMDAVLSLKITAAMTGAAETEARCSALQASIKNEDFALAQVQTRQLGDIVARLNQAAQPFSREQGPPGLDADLGKPEVPTSSGCRNGAMAPDAPSREWDVQARAGLDPSTMGCSADTGTHRASTSQ